MKVALCTPCYDGRVHLDWAIAYSETLLWCIKHEIEMIFCSSRGCANLTRARNCLVAQALGEGADQVFFIDSDIKWRPKDFIRLVKREEDVVCGVPQKRTQEWLEDGQMAVLGLEGAFERDGVLEVQKAPSAFMRIKAPVFQKLVDAGIAKKFLYDQGPKKSQPFMHTWFWYDLSPLDNGSTVEVQDDGEDYYFCRRYREIGGKIHVDLDVELVHFEGLVKHPLTMRQYLKALEEQKSSIIPPGAYEAA